MDSQVLSKLLKCLFNHLIVISLSVLERLWKALYKGLTGASEPYIPAMAVRQWQHWTNYNLNKI